MNSFKAKLYTALHIPINTDDTSETKTAQETAAESSREQNTTRSSPNPRKDDTMLISDQSSETARRNSVTGQGDETQLSSAKSAANRRVDHRNSYERPLPGPRYQKPKIGTAIHPRDTLGGNSFQPSGHSSRSGHGTKQSRDNGGLVSPIGPVHRSVRIHPKLEFPEEDGFDQRPRKKSKIKHAGSTSSVIDLSSEDELNQPHEQNSLPSESHSPSHISRISQQGKLGAKRQTTSIFKQGQNGFRHVDEMMNPTKRRKPSRGGPERRPSFTQLQGFDDDGDPNIAENTNLRSPTNAEHILSKNSHSTSKGIPGKSIDKFFQSKAAYTPSTGSLNLGHGHSSFGEKDIRKPGMLPGERESSPPLRQKFVRIGSGASGLSDLFERGSSKHLRTGESEKQDADADDSIRKSVAAPIARSNMMDKVQATRGKMPKSPGDMKQTRFTSTRKAKGMEPPVPKSLKNGAELKRFDSTMGHMWDCENQGVTITLRYDSDRGIFSVERNEEEASEEAKLLPGKLLRLMYNHDRGDVQIQGIGDLMFSISFISASEGSEFVGYIRDAITLKEVKEVDQHSITKLLFRTRKGAEQYQITKKCSTTVHEPPAVQNEDRNPLAGRVTSSLQDDEAGCASQAEKKEGKQKLISQLQTDDTVKAPDQILLSRNDKRNTTRSTVFNSQVRATRSSNRIATEARTTLPVSFSPERTQRYELGTPWKHPVVYPATGKNRATVEFQDLDRLNEGEFLNDNLVMFYLLWAKQHAQLSPKQVFMFNNFFYTRLTTLEKGLRGINYTAVQRWTSSEDIFSYKYVVVPINEDFHWYVAIICNLDNIKRVFKDSSQDGEVQTSDPVDKPDEETLAHSNFGVAEIDELATKLDSEGALPERTAQLHLDETSRACSVPENPKSQHSSPLPGRSPEQEIQREVKLPETGDSITEDTQSSMLEESVTGLLPAPKPRAESLSRKPRRKPTLLGRTYDPTEPIIIILDSLDSSHPKTSANLKQYLAEEGRVKRAADIKVDKQMKAKGIPQQSNFCDCGVFLVGYIDKFFKDPDEFVRKILTREMDPEIDWPEMDPSNMRNSIRKTLLGLHERQEEERRKCQKIKKNAMKTNRNTSEHPQPADPVSRSPQTGVSLLTENALANLSTELANDALMERRDASPSSPAKPSSASGQVSLDSEALSTTDVSPNSNARPRRDLRGFFYPESIKALDKMDPQHPNSPPSVSPNHVKLVKRKRSPEVVIVNKYRHRIVGSSGRNASKELSKGRAEVIVEPDLGASLSDGFLIEETIRPRIIPDSQPSTPIPEQSDYDRASEGEQGSVDGRFGSPLAPAISSPRRHQLSSPGDKITRSGPRTRLDEEDVVFTGSKRRRVRLTQTPSSPVERSRQRRPPRSLSDDVIEIEEQVDPKTRKR